jgi:UDP-N-acetylmuramoylalanine--D-glutamate ligase
VTEWFDYERYAVWGLGRSGLAAANLLASRGKQVLASDPGKKERPTGLADAVQVDFSANVVGDAQVVVVSPGLRPALAVFDAIQGDIPVISEIELGWEAWPRGVVAITGTDGKSTTTSLAAHIIDQVGAGAVAGGNIGTPICEIALESPEVEWLVAEVSAFQLWTTHRFRPRAAAFTNIAADHMDYFETWQEYLDAKHRMIANCDGERVAFNADDPVIREWGAAYGGPRAWYSVGSRPPRTRDDDLLLWFDGGATIHADIPGQGERPIADIGLLHAVGLRGEHNYANFMAAGVIAFEAGVSFDDVIVGLRGWEPLGHRIEHCGQVDGIEFYDDSKATNANAAIAGIRSIDGELVVIAGGVDKKLDLGDLSALLVERAEHVVLIGEIRERFREELIRAGMGEGAIEFAETMPDAVRRAVEAATPGATVLLSPACSSFDMFDSYAHRGEEFQKAVRSLR